MHSVRLAPTKWILIGTRTTYQDTADAAHVFYIVFGPITPSTYKGNPESNDLRSTCDQSGCNTRNTQSRLVGKLLTFWAVSPQNRICLQFALLITGLILNGARPNVKPVNGIPLVLQSIPPPPPFQLLPLYFSPPPAPTTPTSAAARAIFSPLEAVYQKRQTTVRCSSKCPRFDCNAVRLCTCPLLLNVVSGRVSPHRLLLLPPFCF